MTLIIDDINKYIPNIWKLLNEDPNWDNLIPKINSRPQGIKQFFDCNLYEIMTAANNGNGYALIVLEYFNIVFREAISLPRCLSVDLNSKAIEVLRVLNYNFKNYIGELAVLDSLHKTYEYDGYVIEAPLGNGKSAEYLARKSQTDEQYYVEVRNIHIPTHPTNVKRTLSRKLVNKHYTKTGGTNVEIIVIPVIWTRPFILQEIKSLYSNGFSIENSFEPFAYTCVINSKTGLIDHRFGRLSTLDFDNVLTIAD